MHSTMLASSPYNTLADHQLPHCLHRVDRDKSIRQTWSGDEDGTSQIDGDHRCCWCGLAVSTHSLALIAHGPYRPIYS
jgi:hypothetical protein